MKKLISITIIMISITIIMISLLVLFSCNQRDQVRGFKKEVLQENVLEDLNKEDQLNVSVEELDLKQSEGEFFTPTFYIGEEVYGYVENGVGNKLSMDKFPVGGELKSNLYCVKKDNSLVETPKEVFNLIHSSKNIGYVDSKNGGKLYSIDYIKENTPKEMKDLDAALKTEGVFTDSFISESTGTGKDSVKNEETVIGKDRVEFDNESDGETTYVQIRYSVPFNKNVDRKLYFYDVQKGKLYKGTGDIAVNGQILYVDALKSFVGIDKDLKCYKVVFGNNEYDFVEFLDLKPYIGANTSTAFTVWNLMNTLNDEEVLLQKLEILNNDKHLEYIPFYKTASIGIFNFKTNQFNELLAPEGNKQINVNYIGNVKAIGGETFIIDEYEVENGSIARKERFFKIIEDDKLRTLYKEDIGGESDTMAPGLNVIVREDGKEIFLKKDIILFEMGREVSKGAIYKKYIFE